MFTYSPLRNWTVDNQTRENLQNFVIQTSPESLFFSSEKVIRDDNKAHICHHNLLGRSHIGAREGDLPPGKCKSFCNYRNYILAVDQYFNAETLPISEVKLRILTLTKNCVIEYLENCISQDHCVPPPGQISVSVIDHKSSLLLLQGIPNISINFTSRYN